MRMIAGVGVDTAVIFPFFLYSDHLYLEHQRDLHVDKHEDNSRLLGLYKKFCKSIGSLDVTKKRGNRRYLHQL